MQKTRFTKIVSLLVCAVLIAAAALFTSGCNGTEKPEENQSSSAPTQAAVQATVIGQGKTKFYFNVVDGNGSETSFEINTDENIVGNALQNLGLIEGDEGAYGLYVKKVNGITADYDKTGTYWAFYINGEMAPTGVDSTEITAGETYAFIVSR